MISLPVPTGVVFDSRRPRHYSQLPKSFTDVNDNAEDAMAKVIADVEKEQREELQGTYAATSVGIENQMNSHIFEISSPQYPSPH